MATGSSSEVSLVTFDISALWLLHCYIKKRGRSHLPGCGSLAHAGVALATFGWQIARLTGRVWHCYGNERSLALGCFARVVSTRAAHGSLRWAPLHGSG